MNVFRPASAWKSGLLFLFFGLAGGLGWGNSLFGPSYSTADPATVSEAVAAARNWVAEIDAGQYEQSYEEGCTAFHNKVPQDQWMTVLKAIRPQLGTVISRKEAHTSYKPDGYEGLDGECMVITYNTSFSKMASELEVVVMKREDGKWRGAGYNAQPQVDDASGGDSPISPTPSPQPQPTQ